MNEEEYRLPNHLLNKFKGLPFEELRVGAKYHVYIFYPNTHAREHEEVEHTITDIDDEYVTFVHPLKQDRGKLIKTWISNFQVVEKFSYVTKEKTQRTVKDQQWIFRSVI